MQLKFTDEQYEAVRDRVWAQVAQVHRVSMPSKKERGRAYVEASLPLLAPVLLGPATDEEIGEFFRGRLAGLNAILSARLAKYLPKPVDPALEAAANLFPGIPTRILKEIVDTIRAADRQAK